MKFVPRTSQPNQTNKYYLHYSHGGYNTCIIINGSSTGSVLPNCVGYAQGRFLEIQNKAKVDWTVPNCNAEDFLETAKSKGYKTGTVPKLGAIIVWGVGELHKASDGCGHVGVVEEIGDGYIITSESGYNSSRFWTKKRTNANKNWGADSPYKFLGFIYQNEEYEEKKTIYRVQVGAYSDKKNAEATAKKLNDLGFSTIIKSENI